MATYQSTKNSVIDFILASDNDVLIELNSLIKDCFKKQSSKLKYTLKVGESVNINGTPRWNGGVIEKVNRTRALIKCFCEENRKMMHINVPFSMITKINKEDES